jgi:hypothetical protein
LFWKKAAVVDYCSSPDVYPCLGLFRLFFFFFFLCLIIFGLHVSVPGIARRVPGISLNFCCCAAATTAARRFGLCFTMPFQ